MSTPKKKTKKATSKPRRKAKKKAIPRGTGIKIAVALALLAAIVVGAGLLLQRYLPPAPGTAPAVDRTKKPVTAQKTAPPPKPRKVTPPPPKAATPVKPPIYEIYPTKEKTDRPRTPIRPDRPAAGLPRVAIIIDDIGYDRGLARKFMAFNVPLTFSVLPDSPFGDILVKEIKAQGLELMLHQPMEPQEYPSVNPGPGALLSTMTADELIAQLERNLDRLPGVRGVNNHMGSQLTTESSRMYQVFSVIKKRGLYFIDSRSTADTVCRPSAHMFQVPFAERDIFLDHFQEAAFIRKQFRLLAKEARKHGQAVAIAHPHRVTVQIFKEMLPELQKQVQLVPASEIVHIIG
ncbi:MAG: divergent polysaccharide deacetylase family protein [Deltaproteobacteria bacterium]|nr:divergent polysaccharide deacetylase family protein [Deltaproteobacteria bacterium]